jgi:hypothetical protein
MFPLFYSDVLLKQLEYHCIMYKKELFIGLTTDNKWFILKIILFIHAQKKKLY